MDDWCSTEHKLRTCDKTSQLRDLQHGVLQPRSTYIASTLRSTRCGQDRRSHLYTALQTFVASLMERPAQGHWQAMQQPAGHDLQVGTLVSRGSKNHHKGQCNPCRNHFTAAGCRDGQMCNFCHMPHSKEWLERAAALRELRRAERPQRAPRTNPAREQRTKAQPARYHPEVRSWEGGELHMEHSSFTQAPGERHGAEPGRQQQLLVPEVPDRLSKFESTKGKGKRSKGSKGSQGKGYSAGRVSAAERWLEDEASSSSFTVHGEVMRL